MKMRRVRFSHHATQRLSEVEVQSADRTSILPVLQDVLSRLGLSANEARSKVLGDSLFERVELAEADGRPLTEHRYHEVQAELLSRFLDSAA